ncbi:hypothetical protein [Aquamicrobium defluvii]|uniref:Uncharacterized protein n=1 Tax=Aquamicrobium defluvii TaxID=69279 RepID=A0A4R6Y078_9HYPH|nr:hypothetical protein [Aquamicrobium defluvii]TDR27790.1 hypothetical protein DES43_1653 [Aquamicrobium defluvii]
MTRARHEHQIKINDYTLGGGNTFDAAMNRVVSRWRGLDWFTDEQIAEIRAEMIEREWFRHKLNRENRKRLASKERAA